jgi:hypothetical protein
VSDGRPAAAPILRQALARFRDDDPAATGGYRWLWLACAAALELWDFESLDDLSRQQIQQVRDAGALTLLPLAITRSMVVEAFTGQLREMAALANEVETVTEATGTRLAPYGSFLLAVWRGRSGQVSAMAPAILRDVTDRGEGYGMVSMHWASALFANSVGRYGDALRSAERPWRARSG